MESKLKAFIESHNQIYLPIQNNTSKEKIYDLLTIDKLFTPTTSDEFHYMAFYYEYLVQDEALMISCYLKAINLKNIASMRNLGTYYGDIKKYDLMKKYYMMAINRGDSHSMCYFADYCNHIEHNYSAMKKYYQMSINKRNSSAMNNLAWYYQNVEKNYNLMEKYYLMAADHKNSTAMYNLALFYKTLGCYDKMKKYYLMAIDNGDIQSLIELDKYYLNEQDFFERMLLFTKYYYLIDRTYVIDSINNVGMSTFDEKKAVTFIKVIGEFEFNEQDNLCMYIRLLLRSINGDLI